MNASTVQLIAVAALASCLTACDHHKDHGEHAHAPHHKIVTTSPQSKDITLTRQYVCQIHSQRHINVKALENGYLEQIPVKEGQAVKTNDVLFRVVPALYKARLDAELAEVQLAKLELANTQRLQNDKVVSQNEVALFEAKLAKAEAKARLAQAELNFTEVRAPFDGIIDRLHEQQGSLVKEGDILTTLSDNSTMWAYFNVPETRYLEHMAGVASRGKAVAGAKKIKHGAVKSKGKKDDEDDDDDDDDDDDKDQDDRHDNIETQQIDLLLANGNKFKQTGRIGAIEAKFNSETGNIPFRADFPNPDRLLRHGQTGNVHIHRTLKNALVIPQRVTFEILDKRYVYVVGDDHVVHQREITVLHEMDDVFVIAKGLALNEKFVLEGVRQVHDGEKIEAEHRKADHVIAHQKQHAE